MNKPAQQENNTWDLVDLPLGKNSLLVSGVFKVKLKSDGSLEWYTASLVAKGDTQDSRVWSKLFRNSFPCGENDNGEVCFGNCC